jgi:hypothetical protein
MNHEIRERSEELGGSDGFALLGMKSGPSLDILAYDAEEGKVLCIFETQKLADAFSRVSPEVRGQGWQVHVMTVEKLPELLESFDYVTINPSPGQGSQKELVSASGFARSLQHRGIEQ